MLKVYGSKSCGKCISLKRLLESKGVEFEYLDISEHSEISDKYSVRALPFILEDGVERSFEEIKNRQ